ncbi:MAG: polysaccharide pyruvyl transferase family protein [Candidatus Saccharibacteria bacterium]|nr:polysaccharide pyruvyl transferase family protein [Candidatus Saccharibacteria bacterium]
MMNKKIAVFTHFYVCNFGANLQALSTSCYLKRNGWDPIFINWVGYQSKIFGNVNEEQVKAHYSFANRHLNISPELQNAEEIYDYLVKNEIFNVILGSDAVFALDTFVDRINISKKGLKVKKSAPDKIFPNPFWLEFLVDDNRFKIAAMSVSSQNCFYHVLSSKIKARIKRCLNRFDYISVRDEWTQNMVKSLAGRDVDITPDPVWAFNYNCEEILNERSNIQSLLEIKKPYVLLGFQNAYVSQTKKFLDDFIPKIEECGFQSIPLPFAFGYYNSSLYSKQVELPLDALDWYRLIQESSGYIGYNMHPIIASMHNNKPCISIDNYGINFAKRINIRRSSKIYDIMSRMGRAKQCIEIRSFFREKMQSLDIVSMLKNYDIEEGRRIASVQHTSYNNMMNSILKVF